MDLLFDHDNVQHFIRNLSTNRMIQFIKDMKSNDYLKNQYGLWSGKYDVPLSSIITKYGLCYNFNLQSATDLFHLDK